MRLFLFPGFLKGCDALSRPHRVATRTNMYRKRDQSATKENIVAAIEFRTEMGVRDNSKQRHRKWEHGVECESRRSIKLDPVPPP